MQLRTPPRVLDRAALAATPTVRHASDSTPTCAYVMYRPRLIDPGPDGAISASESVSAGLPPTAFCVGGHTDLRRPSQAVTLLWPNMSFPGVQAGLNF